SSLRTTGSVSASSGSTSTPPSVAAIRTSRPPTARYTASLAQTVARSGPKRRNRDGVSLKSNGADMAREAMPGRELAPLVRPAVLDRVADPEEPMVAVNDHGEFPRVVLRHVRVRVRCDDEDACRLRAVVPDLVSAGRPAREREDVAFTKDV